MPRELIELYIGLQVVWWYCACFVHNATFILVKMHRNYWNHSCALWQWNITHQIVCRLRFYPWPTAPPNWSASWGPRKGEGMERKRGWGRDYRNGINDKAQWRKPSPDALVSPPVALLTFVPVILGLSLRLPPHPSDPQIQLKGALNFHWFLWY